MDVANGRMGMRCAGVLAALVLWAGSTAAAMQFGTSFWDLGWHSPSDCFSNVNNVTGDNPWNPQFLADVEPFSVFRFMDWDRTNSSTRSTWSQRTVMSARVQNPVAYEWMIDLCNRTTADMYVCQPHMTINRSQGDNPSDYTLRLCILVKTGVDMGTADLSGLGDLSTRTAADFIAAGGTRTCEPLASSLRLFLEYSNETWNTAPAFQQSFYAQAEGIALGLESTAQAAAARFNAWASLRMFHAADLVFGPNSPRVVKVLAGWVTQPTVSVNEFAVLDSARLNPWGIRADAVSIAPYIGHSATTVDALAADTTNCRAACNNFRRFADAKGVDLHAYEVGQHVLSNAVAVNRDPRMYDVYMGYFTMLNRYFDMVTHYNHVGDWSDGGAWGSMEYTGQPLAQAHKRRAIVDWLAANPPTAVRRTVGVSAQRPDAAEGAAQWWVTLNGRAALSAPARTAASGTVVLTLRDRAAGCYVSRMRPWAALVLRVPLVTARP